MCFDFLVLRWNPSISHKIYLLLILSAQHWRHSDWFLITRSCFHCFCLFKLFWTALLSIGVRPEVVQTKSLAHNQRSVARIYGSSPETSGFKRWKSKIQKYFSSVKLIIIIIYLSLSFLACFGIKSRYLALHQRKTIIIFNLTNPSITKLRHLNNCFNLSDHLP